MTTHAFVFPGQGSQRVGMCVELSQHSRLIAETFAQAADVLDYDLWSLLENGPVEALNRTEVTQPALLTASYAMWRVWLEQGGQLPAVMAGHSLGEYTALVCAGVIDFAAGVKLVRERGRLMQTAVPQGEGGMAAIIGVDPAAITLLCEQAAEGEVLSAANFNSPGQVVIAGTAAAISRACAMAKSVGAKMAKRLDVSVPSHCALMQPAAEVFAEQLHELVFHPPHIPVIQNTDAQSHDNVDSIKQILLQQLYRPVRWEDSVNKMSASAVSQIVECGPGKVLSGLIKRIDSRLLCYSVQDKASLDDSLQEINA